MNNNSNCDPIYSSVYTDSNYDGDCVNGRVRIRSSGSDRIKHQSSRDRAGSLEAFYGNNTDPSMRQRTFSMDSKRGCFKSSLLLRAGQNPGLSPNPLKSSTSTPKQNDEKHESKKIPPLWGSLSLPIFIPQIVSSLIDNTFEFPEKPIKKAGFNETPLVERYIRNHAASLQSAYAKAYVHVLFESLQNHEAVHTYDVLNAVKYCDKEIFQSIDAKDFVDSICGHNDEIDEESYENNVYVDPRPCHSPNHFAIKKKFSDILGTYFQLVPGFKDLYYFYSSAEQTHYHGNRRDTIANDVDIEVASSLAKHLDSKRSCDVNPSLSFGTKSRPQNSSLGSIMTNESSNINETQDDFDGISIASNNNGCVFNPGGIDQPLFIQIFANHCKQEIQANGPPLTEIPTCWMELIGKTDEEGSYNPKDLFSIHLVAICLQPQTMCCNIPDNSMWASSVNLDFRENGESMKVDDGTLNISKYTGTQKKALENIVEEIQWMMRNEIIYSMTKTHTVNESVLKKVTEHITVSINKPGCAVQRFPLSFVLKPEKSLKSFIAQFEEIDLLQGYKILREGNYYYIVQEGGGDSMSCASSGSINNTMSCGNVLDEHQRFQLSPVKEVASIPNKRKHSENSHKPTCWLIVFIEDDIVSIYFQYREGQLSIVLPWRQALASLSANIKAICKSVNQEMLLIDLFESRLCHRLLESDKNEESSFNWNAHNYFSVQQQMQLQKQEMETNNSMANIDLRFKPGFFSCSIVWETYFCLHPRLKHFDHQLSRGIKAIKLKLSTFQVQNRHNIFVYMDENDNIYYITIREGSSTGCYEVEGDESRFISRTSSFSSCVAKNNGVSSTETMDNLSILSQSVDTPQFNSCTKINLKVQGLIEPGDDIKVHLVSTLEQELNEQVIEVISEVLQRNPRSKLSPMDVSFLQPSNNPDLTFSFYIPSNTSEKSVFSYLKQNLTHFQTKIPFIEPKYSSSKSEHHFRDQESSCTYIYTECGKIGRHKGIGVIKVEYHSEEFNESGIKSSDKGNNSSSEVFKSEDFVRFTNVSEEDSVDTNRSIIFSLWERGKLSVEKLKESLKTSLNSKSKFEKIIRLSTPDIICRMFHNSVEDGRGFICIRNEENVMTSQSDFYLIGQARKVEKNLDEEKELGTPNSDSYYRKFQSMPYSPRRDIIFIHVSRNEISFWVYNVSKDVVYQISKSVSSLSHWMSARSCLTTSIVSQKLGIFHNTKFNRKCQEQSDNPYLGSKGGIAYVELLVNNKAVPSKVSTSNAVESNKYQNNPKRINRFLSIYRDTKPSCLLSESPYANGNDPMKQHGSQMLHMKASDNKEMLSRLYFLWQNRGESSGNTIIFNNQVLKFFKKSARLVHFCLTPLLFLPHWRSQAHSTRLDIINPLDLSIHRRPQVEERSHIGLIQNYVQEYIQYLHTLGFIAIQRRVNNANSGNIYNHRKVGKRDLHQDSIKNVIFWYTQEDGQGVIQPFFFTKLYVMEYDRLICHYNFRRESNLVTGLGVTPEAIKESFTRKLIDECDNIKHLIHLHSFTYDYHLRTAHNFISGRPSNISKGFHLAFFIDDFLKYYNKGPNFARNMKGYDLKVLRMEPLDAKANEDFECDYLLVRQSSSLTSQDQDTNGTSPSSSGSGSSMNIGNNLPGSFVSGYDDYDFVLLLINDDFHSSHENLNLKYYIILTSKRDLYPTYNVDKTKGQFRTVLKNECTKPLGAKKDDTASSIQRESVNYVGFYSSREQSMEKIMSSMILATETMNGIVFVEFNELLTLVDIEPFEKINDELVAIVSRPLRWFKSLMKLMSTRYPVSRLFGAPDGSVQHLVIQDSIHKCVDSCILITMDTPNEETSLNLIFKEQSDI
ncbi:SZT2 [Lepeophtheirus salmonis]|uniref:SZT2 n=1 Tax=Lepeophtheirus salmonis TaxID=72036 RepID=A0A7R8CQA8_LEPSM|nr:SZT2 [Lepeophtheirus salmonis]CAF2846165.1 SZT2 [Lepeophtheirus salmonis]